MSTNPIGQAALDAPMTDSTDLVKGPWTAQGVVLYSEDFTHDVIMKVEGDFESHEQRREYVRQLADILNRAALSTPASLPAMEDGWKLIAVKNLWPLLDALARADNKGYMPDAMAKEWEDFDYRDEPASQPAAASTPETEPTECDNCKGTGEMFGGYGCDECGGTGYAPSKVKACGAAVYLVCTGEAIDGRETYTRHDEKPLMCDYETLHSAQPAAASTLSEQVTQAQAEIATWSPERRANCQIEGSDPYSQPAAASTPSDEALDRAIEEWYRNDLNTDRTRMRGAILAAATPQAPKEAE